jgi:hypothetical protein
MPDEEKPLPEDIEIEISRLSAEAAGKLLRKDQAEIAQKQAHAAAARPAYSNPAARVVFERS